MSWLASFGVALLTALLTLFGAGTVAGLAVDWYNISSFEGGAGFFVVGMALFGLIGGFVAGLVASRVVARRPRPGFLKGLGVSSGAVALILAAIAGASWMLADIPPQIDGEELFLLTEIRWPAAGAVPPSEMTGATYLRLGALSGSTVRRLERGPLFFEDARQDNGRWIVPGAVPIFTTRGGRLLDFGTREQSVAGFVVPLPRRPGEAQRQWSDWLPGPRDGEAEKPDAFTYRFKVIRRSEAVRTERVGPFDVDTVADYFYDTNESERMAMSASFRLRYNGQPLPEIAAASTVAVVSGPMPALFVTISEPSDQLPCALVVDEGPTARVQRIPGCAAPVTTRLLTSDRDQFSAAKARVRVPGWIDREEFAEPGLFQLDSAVLDTRDFSTAQFLFPEDVRPDTSLPPLDLSPDERSFVWLASAMDDQPGIGVTDWRTSRSYVLPIDAERMRYPSEAALDPDWVRHHFEWRREDGVDILVERPDFVPLPHRGDLGLAKAGEYQSYRLSPGGDGLRDAIVELLVGAVGGERLPDEPAGWPRVRVRGKVVSVSVLGTPSYVSVSMSGSDGDPEVMAAIAKALDQALASGRYDPLFVAPPAPQ